MRTLIAMLLTPLVLSSAYADKETALPRASREAVVLENAVCRYEIGLDGVNRALINRADGKNYCAPGQPFMQVLAAGKLWPATRVALAGSAVTVTFGDSGVSVQAALGIYAQRFTVTIQKVTGPGIEWLELCNLCLQPTPNVGPLVNAAWDDTFGVCVLACNDRTDSAGADATKAVLAARCYREYGLEGAKVAIVAVPTGKPDPAARLLSAIGETEIAEGLPHPMKDGVWIKQSKERFYSYLMLGGCGEANIDQVIDYAKGGFGCIEIYPWASTPSYRLDPTLFPHGIAGLKQVADKVHAAGLKLGIHCMQGMVGWGAKDDPYLVPKADPRLLQDRHATLAAALDPKATEVTVREATEGWPGKGDLLVDGEVIRYTKRTPTGFSECQRGLYGTTVSPHAAGLRLGHLVNCFDIWGFTVYAPDITTSILGEICDNIARVFNVVGADMAYFDGGEEVIKQPPFWRNQGQIALGVQKRLKQPVILEGNALYTNLSWHVITRGSPHFDPIYFGRREYTLRNKGQNPASWAKNLLTGDVGWFAPHTASPTTDAVTPDEVLLLCLKALGGKAPISFSVDANSLWGNKRMPEMLDIIRACDELKRRDYFTEEACAELARPMAEHSLEQTADGHWNLRPLQFGTPQVVTAGRAETSAVSCKNPFPGQRPWVRIRARQRLAPYGAKENVVLADFGGAVPFKVSGSASPELVPSVEPSPEKTPDGASTFCFRAESNTKSPSGWCQLTLPFAKPLNLTAHRRLGLWIRGDNSGGILNVQLAGTDCRRDHYIPLDFTGWAYRELDPPEDKRTFDYSWPYSWTDLLYTVQPVYGAAKELNLYYNGLPAGAKAACLIGRIEALQEQAVPLQSPALELAGQKLTFPVALQSEEYLELDWLGRCRHFDPNGGLLGEVNPQGSLRLAAGDNALRFSCDTGPQLSPRAEVSVALRGEPLANVRRKTALPDVRYPSLSSPALPVDETLRVLPGGGRDLRIVQGAYELAGGASAFGIVAFDGKHNVWQLDNPLPQAQRAAVVLTRGSSQVAARYDDPRGVTLEAFDDLRPYELSTTNQFEKYVIGGGKQISADGPVRAGVTQSFTASRDGAQAGKSCGVYTARNSGEAGGWCAKGKRFAKPVDLSGQGVIALWLCGDAKREVLRLQFRDTQGRNADWLVPVDFSGWRLLRFPMAEARDFDWKQVEYVIFYFNDLPTDATCTLKLDDLRALPAAGQPVLLRQAALLVNHKRIVLPHNVGPAEALAVDGHGLATVWQAGKQRGKALPTSGGPLLLQPGANSLELTCDATQGAPDDVSVKVIPLGP